MPPRPDLCDDPDDPAMQCPTCNTQVDESQRFCPSCGTVLSAADPQGPDPLIGQTLGTKYKVIRLIGEGGMGAVYEGEQQLGTTKRKVAVKTLHPHLSRDAKIKARFEREVGTIAELEHPNTIQVYDFGTTPEGILYLVMEFLSGRSLADILEKDGPMSGERTEHILQQVCGSLEEAHGRGIVHRDLKPDNVVLLERAGKKDFVKVLDFGIAKRSREEDKNEQKLTQQGMVLGTPPYMSPEQFTGRPIDARSDIYSLGVMAYEMLTGKLPFKADTAWEWATQHMTQQPIPIESLAEGMRAPAPMRAAITRALAKSPDDRFQTVREFCDAFSASVASSAAAGVAAAAAVRSGTAPFAASGPAGGMAMGSGPSGGKQRTEIGTPLQLDAGLSFGAGGAPPPMGPAAQGYTPVGGNVAFPTPAGIPQPPARETSGGGGRTMLLVVAGLVGIASVGAIIFAVKGHSTGQDVIFGDAGGPSAATSDTPSTTDTPPPPDPSAGGDIPSLSGTSSHGVPHNGPGPGPGPGPTHSGNPPQPPPPPPPAKYDGPDCQNARRLLALGHKKEAQPYVLTCLANKGNPYP
jgi:tRNA A-37 threonylcarbamoyl transferase component Bud32